MTRNQMIIYSDTKMASKIAQRPAQSIVGAILCRIFTPPAMRFRFMSTNAPKIAENDADWGLTYRVEYAIMHSS
jgi:hypothetical protein